MILKGEGTEIQPLSRLKYSLGPSHKFSGDQFAQKSRDTNTVPKERLRNVFRMPRSLHGAAFLER